MIFENQLYDIILLILPIVIFSVLGITYEDAHKIEKGKLIDGLMIYLFALIIPIGAGVGAIIIYSYSPNLSIFLYVLILIDLIIIRFLIFPIVDVVKGYPKFFDRLQFVLMFLPVVILLVEVPTIYMSNQENNSKVQMDLLSTTEIEQSFSTIQHSFSDIDNVIKKETKNINELTQLLKKRIEEKNLQLTELNNQQSELQKQIKYYKELSKISEEQSEALLQALDKGKYFEYVIGLFLGLVSSLIASLLYNKYILKN